MRRVELADHLVDDVEPLLTIANMRDKWFVLHLHRVPVVAVHLGIVEAVPVGRETGIDITRAMHGDEPHVLAALVRRPDVSEIGKDDAAGMVMRISHEFRLAPC
jgi:hypothetical protein